MTSETAAPRPGGPPATAGPDGVPRVRHQARDAVTLMSFSLLVSLATALGLVVLTHLGL